MLPEGGLHVMTSLYNVVLYCLTWSDVTAPGAIEKSVIAAVTVHSRKY